MSFFKRKKVYPIEIRIQNPPHSGPEYNKEEKEFFNTIASIVEALLPNFNLRYHENGDKRNGGYTTLKFLPASAGEEDRSLSYYKFIDGKMHSYIDGVEYTTVMIDGNLHIVRVE